MEKDSPEYMEEDDFWDFGTDRSFLILVDEPARVIHVPFSRSKDEDVPAAPTSFGMDKEMMGMEKEISLYMTVN